MGARDGTADVSAAFAYKSSDPDVLAWWDDAERGQREFREKIDAFVAEHGMGREAVILSGWGTSLGGLEVYKGDKTDSPEGWRVVRNDRFRVLVPLRRTKAGKTLSDEMKAIRVGDPRMSLPGWTWEILGGMPGLFLHDGFVWMSANRDDGVDLDVWTPCRLAEFYTAQDAHDDAIEAERAESA